MAYERIDRPEGLLYHYTKRENLESILKDGRIRKFKDRESWFCTSLEDNGKAYGINRYAGRKSVL